MEHINRIELRGIVGCDARIFMVNDTRVARFSMATNLAYRGQDGQFHEETTWHNIVAWEGSGIMPLDDIKKGRPVHLTGRIRNNRYTDTSGAERMFYEVKCSMLEPVSPEAE